MTAIIFGATGQDGYYLSKFLREKKVEVTGVSRGGDFLRTNICSLQEVSDLVRTNLPDFIFHFAANSTTHHDALFENHETIATGTLNILEAVKCFSPRTKVFISGSALQFLNEGKPISENTPFTANDAYAVSRIQSIYAARYFHSIGVKAYVGYFFNHDSFLRSERHIAKKISAAANRIAAGSNEILEIGDLAVVKEWSYAGDVINAVWLLMKQDDIIEAVIGSGEGYSVKDWADECFGLVGLDSGNYIKKAGDFISPYRSLVSDNTLIKSLGYTPKISFNALAKKMILNEE